MTEEEFKKIVEHGLDLRKGLDRRFAPLAFGAIAAVWVLISPAFQPLPPVLLIALALAAVALAADFAEVFVSYLVYRDPHSLRRTFETNAISRGRRLLVSLDPGKPTIVVRVPLARFLFGAKVASLACAYIVLGISIWRKLL